MAMKAAICVLASAFSEWQPVSHVYPSANAAMSLVYYDDRVGMEASDSQMIITALDNPLATAATSAT